MDVPLTPWLANYSLWIKFGSWTVFCGLQVKKGEREVSLYFQRVIKNKEEHVTESVTGPWSLDAYHLAPLQKKFHPTPAPHSSACSRLRDSPSPRANTGEHCPGPHTHIHIYPIYFYNAVPVVPCFSVSWEILASQHYLLVLTFKKGICSRMLIVALTSSYV